MILNYVQHGHTAILEVITIVNAIVTAEYTILLFIIIRKYAVIDSDPMWPDMCGPFNIQTPCTSSYGRWQMKMIRPNWSLYMRRCLARADAWQVNQIAVAIRRTPINNAPHRVILFVARVQSESKYGSALRSRNPLQFHSSHYSFCACTPKNV